jgi:CDP-6-deoxy-D-xylo-4-hexulose-3-dehydrase
MPELKPEDFPEVEHIHFFGYYIGNYPSLSEERIVTLCEILNSVEIF